MKLLPSLRQKKRYVVFALKSSQKFMVKEVQEEVERALQQFLGDLGWSKAGPMFLKEKFNPATQRFMLKVNHNYVDELKMALTLSKNIKNTPVIIKSIIVSGTLKKASQHLNEVSHE